MGIADWIQIGIGFVTLIGIFVSAYAIRKSAKDNQKSIQAQWDMYHQQKTDDNENIHQDKIKAAHVIINIIPSIVLEGFIICNNKNDGANKYVSVRDAGTVFASCDFVGSINLLTDILSKDEVLFLYRLSALINKLKLLLQGMVNVTLADKDKYIYKLAYNAYLQLILAFCDGFPKCNEKYHCANIAKTTTPFFEIAQHAPDYITIDLIMEKSNSYFSHKFRDNEDDIYCKLKKITEEVNING